MFSENIGFVNSDMYEDNSFFFSAPVCAITVSGMPGGTLVSMNRFITLCG
jgi:hypothetical protein